MCEQTEMTKKKTASPSPQNKNAPKKMNVPNPLIIIVCIILLGALASYIIPAGSFTRVEDPNTGRMVVDPASFSYVDADPTGFFELFMVRLQRHSGQQQYHRFSVHHRRCLWYHGGDGRDPRRNGHPGPQNEGA